MIIEQIKNFLLVIIDPGPPAKDDTTKLPVVDDKQATPADDERADPGPPA